MPIPAEPGSSGFSGEDRTLNIPLSTRTLETLGDNLLTSAFDGATANHIAHFAKTVILHAVGIIAEVGHSL